MTRNNHVNKVRIRFRWNELSPCRGFKPFLVPSPCCTFLSFRCASHCVGSVGSEGHGYAELSQHGITKRPWLCHSAAIACPESCQKRTRLIRGVFLCVRALLDIIYYRLTSRKGRSSACSVSQLQVPFVQKFKSIFVWLNTYVHEIRGIIVSGTLLGILSTPLD